MPRKARSVSLGAKMSGIAVARRRPDHSRSLARSAGASAAERSREKNKYIDSLGYVLGASSGEVGLSGDLGVRTFGREVQGGVRHTMFVFVIGAPRRHQEALPRVSSVNFFCGGRGREEDLPPLDESCFGHVLGDLARREFQPPS